MSLIPRPKPATAKNEGQEERTQLAQQALEELARLEPDQAEALAYELLAAAEQGLVPLFPLLGYSDRDLFTIYRKAHTLQKAGFPKQALELCEGLIALDPAHLAVRMLAACCCIELQDYPRSLELLEALRSDFPADPEIWLKRGLALFRLKRYIDAGLSWKRVLELDPGLTTEEAKQATLALQHLHQAMSQ